MRFHPRVGGAADTRCVTENTVLGEHKVPAVMATGTGVCECVSVWPPPQGAGQLLFHEGDYTA